MKVQSAHLNDFRRFTDLTIRGIPEAARLVVLLGPNGSGKSSLFDGFNFWTGQIKSSMRFQADYHLKEKREENLNWRRMMSENVEVKFHDREVSPFNATEVSRKAFYFRSAYRNESDFTTRQIGQIADVLEDKGHPASMILADKRVSTNYKRIVSDTVRAVYDDTEDEGLTRAELRDRILGEVRQAMSHVFDNLMLRGPGRPLSEGTFFFDKGEAKNFKYKNLSGGEKAAFDLLLDLVVKKEYFDDTVYCIDEPEMHMHTKLQARLLKEMYKQVPATCQLWIATHSIGMMRKAKELHQQNRGQVQFIDFGGNNFDETVELTPKDPDRLFWKDTFQIAIGDLANLVAPHRIIFCEGGRPEQGARSNARFDARCFSNIFGDEYPDTEFVSLGGHQDVERNSVLLSAVLEQMFDGIEMSVLIDRDDRNEEEVEELASQGTRVLSRRDLENYIWDDEILKKLCHERNQSDKKEAVLEIKRELLEEAVERGNPEDDVDSISGQLYVRVKRELNLTQCGNTAVAFARDTLAPLVSPDTQVYSELREDVFG